MKRYRFHTGPAIVHQVAEDLRRDGLVVYLEGAQHVYFMTDQPVAVLSAKLPSLVRQHQILACN